MAWGRGSRYFCTDFFPVHQSGVSVLVTGVNMSTSLTFQLHVAEITVRVALLLPVPHR